MSMNFLHKVKLCDKLFYQIKPLVPLSVRCLRCSTNIFTSKIYLEKHIRMGNMTYLSNQKKIPSFVPLASTMCTVKPNSSIPPSSNRGTSSNKKAVFSWRNLIITSVFGGCLLLFISYIKKEKELANERERRRNMGKMKIGGKFKLIDHNGEPRASEDFLGKWSLIYFGFTHCPDICPDELEKLAQVVDNINGKERLSKIQPLFITVDPQRDSAKAVKEYVKEFHPDMIGLTGSVEAIAEACKGFRVYFSSGPKDVDDDYIVDHTIIMYLVDPNFDFVDYYGQNKDADEVTNSVKINMAKFEQLGKSGVRAVLNI